MLTLRHEENNLNTANLYLKESRALKISTPRSAVADITGLFQSERERTKDFIKAIYKKSYNADIAVEYPVLMSVRNENDDILAAVGFRYASAQSLFLENYTAKPIDKILACERSEIAEIGNLASSGKGALVFLFAAMSSYLRSQDIRYAAVTGTDFLHNYFDRANLKPIKICDASINALQSDGQNWGTYYDTQPRVLVGSVDDGVKNLAAKLGAKSENCLHRLFSRLHYKVN